MSGFSFPKSMRLLSNSQFRLVLNNRLSQRDDNLVVYARENGLDFPRLGISIGKAAGNAVKRNRLKRLIREAFRLNQKRIPSGFDYVITVPAGKNNSNYAKSPGKKAPKAFKFEEIQASFLTLTSRFIAQ